MTWSSSHFAAVVVAFSWAMAARADVVVKDTLDPANYESVFPGGGFITQNVRNTNTVDGRTHVGFRPFQSGRLAELALSIIAFNQGTDQPEANPARSTLLDLSVAQYGSFLEAMSQPLRVDAFFPESTQPHDVFENPVGMTSSGLGYNAAEVYLISYDLRPHWLDVTPGQNNYLGVSATGVPIGIDFQPQRSDNSGLTNGSEPDYLSGSIFQDQLVPLSDFYSDAFQISVRITITNFGDARDGDYNGDGVVDAVDFTVWRDNYGATSGSGLIADGNVDGVVSGADFLLWQRYYGQTVPISTPAGALTVPEPTALALVAFAFGLAVQRRADR